MKVFASDFDNTLHFRNENGGYFKPEDIEAVKSFQEHGNMFGLCTGRPGNGFGSDLDGGPEMNFMIVSTGSLILDHEGNTLYEARIPLTDMYELEELTGNDGSLYIHADGDVYTLYQRRQSYPSQTVLNSLEELKDNHITGVSIETVSDECAAALTERLNSSFKCQLIAFQNRNWLDIIQTCNSKGIAAQKAKEMFKADMVAGIGDAFNDRELIRLADVSFTFPYAPKELQVEADYVVNSVAEAIAIFEKL